MLHITSLFWEHAAEPVLSESQSHILPTQTGKSCPVFFADADRAEVWSLIETADAAAKEALVAIRLFIVTAGTNSSDREYT